MSLAGAEPILRFAVLRNQALQGYGDGQVL
jgi:hypothetical protein